MVRYSNIRSVRDQQFIYRCYWYLSICNTVFMILSALSLSVWSLRLSFHEGILLVAESCFSQFHIVSPLALLLCAFSSLTVLIASVGVAGIIVGGTSGIIRGSAPVLFAGAAGAQWFALGSTFWGRSRHH